MASGRNAPWSLRPGAWGECRVCLEGMCLTSPQQAFTPWGLAPHDGPAKLARHALCVSRHPLFRSHQPLLHQGCGQSYF